MAWQARLDWGATQSLTSSWPRVHKCTIKAMGFYACLQPYSLFVTWHDWPWNIFCFIGGGAAWQITSPPVSPSCIKKCCTHLSKIPDLLLAVNPFCNRAAGGINMVFRLNGKESQKHDMLPGSGQLSPVQGHCFTTTSRAHVSEPPQPFTASVPL